MADHRNTEGQEVLALRASGEGRRAAILDIDRGFLLVLGKRLERAGWRHEVLPRKVSLRALTELEIDALVVDVELLGADRLRWIERVCRERPDLSVIICTASSTVAERVRALRLGIDDWLAKPCHPEELLARMESASHHRRARSRKLAPSRIGEVEIRPDQYQAFVGALNLGLTRREYQLIELLDGARGEVLPRERIYECLWGYEMVRNERSVDVFVHKLRRKLEHGSPGWSYIHTHFGIGYRLAAEPVLPAETVAEPLAA
jgi:DNA-binding response OmpR family regulator